MLDPTYPLFPVFAFIAFVLGLVPLTWHLESWNAGTCAYMLWASTASLIEFVNAMVWRDTAMNLAPVWCDISSKFLLGAGVGIPASSLCICRRLYNIVSVQSVTITRRDKRRMVIEDVCIAVGIPVLVMILHYIVQGHRFDILENIGCYAVVYVTLPAYFLVYMWPVLLGCLSFVYAGLTLRAFWKRRMEFNELITSSNAAAINSSRFLRLMLLSCTEMVCTIPIGTYSIYISTTGFEISPWVSWANTHYDFSRVDMVPAIIWRSDHTTRISVEMTRWLLPVSALVFFALFGFANEAQRHYRLAFWWIARQFGCKPQPDAPKQPALRYGAGKPSTPSCSGHPPPSYRSSVSSIRQSQSDSFGSTLAGSELHKDVEKDAGRDSCSSSYSETDTETNASFISSDYKSAMSFDITTPESKEILTIDGVEYSLYPYQSRTPRPPSPEQLHENPVVPGYHRPFSPSNIRPISSSAESIQDGGVHVTIHEESTTSL